MCILSEFDFFGELVDAGVETDAYGRRGREEARKAWQRLRRWVHVDVQNRVAPGHSNSSASLDARAPKTRQAALHNERGLPTSDPYELRDLKMALAAALGCSKLREPVRPRATIANRLRHRGGSRARAALAFWARAVHLSSLRASVRFRLRQIHGVR